MQIGQLKSNGQRYVVQREGDAYLPLPYRSVIEAICDPELGQSREEPLAVNAIDWLPPVSNPRKIFCIGRNYAEHAAESGSDIPDIPVVFSKFATALTGHRHPVLLPAISEEVDFEAEMVVVIGKRGRSIPRESAMEHVFGVTAGNDISARDWQKGRPGGQWLLGKTFDSFAPLGPTITTIDEISDVQSMPISFYLNGTKMQDASTRQMIFPVDFLVSHLSAFCTLEPGDLIFTGTPSGVGAARKPPRFLQAGDQMQVVIGGIDALQNDVVSLG